MNLNFLVLIVGLGLAAGVFFGKAGSVEQKSSNERLAIFLLLGTLCISEIITQLYKEVEFIISHSQR